MKELWPAFTIQDMLRIISRAGMHEKKIPSSCFRRFTAASNCRVHSVHKPPGLECVISYQIHIPELCDDNNCKSRVYCHRLVPEGSTRVERITHGDERTHVQVGGGRREGLLWKHTNGHGPNRRIKLDRVY